VKNNTNQAEDPVPATLGFYKQRGKRLLDIILTLPGLVLASPLLFFVAILIWILSGPPVFFRQKRPGLAGRVFTLLKFCTMTDARDGQGNLRPDSDRLTPVGRFLRRTSLDELPELMHVLKGDMSLVGPRPLLVQYLERYSPKQARRHEVKPGLTGWAQVNGRNALNWEQKFDLDVWYVDHVSLWLDFKILWMTLTAVLKREGISADNSATMPEFMGTSQSISKRGI
jgi:sugar transferase EpsL